MPSINPLVHFVLEPEAIKKVDDFRFQHRFVSRSAAIKWLLEWALTQNPEPPDGKGQVVY